MDIGELKAKLIADANQMKAGIQAARKEFQDLGKQANNTSKEFNTLNKTTSGLGSVLASLGSTAALGGLTGVFKQVVNEAQKLTNSMIGLRSIANSFGVDASKATEEAKKLAEDGLAPVSTYATSLKNLLSTGIGLDKATELIDVFKDRAAFGRANTISFDQAVQNLSETFKTESSELGDLSGMTENYSLILSKGLKVLQDRGETLAKNVDQLTEAERAEAKYLGILAVSQPYLGDAIKLTETFSGKQAQLNAKWTEAKQNLGEALIPELERLMEIVTPLIDEFVVWTEKNQGVISGMAASATTALTLTTAITGLSAAFTILRASLGVWGAIATAAGIAGAAILAYKEGVDISTQAVKSAETQQQRSFINMANQAEALEGKLSTLKEGTAEYERTSGHLKQVYDQIIAQNPDLKKAYDEQGGKIGWLRGEVKKLGDEYLRTARNAFMSSAADIDKDLSNKRRLLYLAEGEVAQWEDVPGDKLMKKQVENKRKEIELLRGDITQLLKEKMAAGQEYSKLLQPVNLPQLENDLDSQRPPGGSPPPDGSPPPKGRGVTKSKDDIISETFRSELSIANARYELQKQKYGDTEKLLEGHVNTLKGIESNYSDWLAKNEQERLQLATDIKSKENELDHRTFQTSIDWIEERKFYNELSLEEELKAWERVHSRYAEGSEEQKQAAREVYRVRKEMADKAKEDAENAYREITKILKEQEADHLDYLRDKHEKEIKRLEENLKSVEESYDRQIKKQEEKLRLLDREYEKQDRLKQFSELDERESKIKADRRFEKILEDGTKILTYDEAAVAEIEKQRSELKEQYEREDVKQAIRDEIDRLKTAKDEKVSILQAELTAIKDKNAQEIQEAKDRWEKLIKAAEEGTLSFDELMSGENGWYSKSIGDLEKYADGVEAQMARVRAAFKSIESMAPGRSSGGGGGHSDDDGDYLDSGGLDAPGPISPNSPGAVPKKKSNGLSAPSFHTGGNTGGLTGLFNFRSPFELSHDEITAILQRNEWVFQQGQLNSLLDFAASNAQQQEVHQEGDIIIHQVNVVANNVGEMKNSLDEYRRAVRR